MKKYSSKSNQRSQSNDRQLNKNNQRNREKYNQRQRSRSPYHKNKQHYLQINKPKKQQQTKTLCIEDINFTIQQIQPELSQISISIGTSLPDDIQVRQKNIYIRYPSIQVASSVYNQLKGYIYIKTKSKSYKLRYYPFKSANLNIVYDWYCNKCDYKNFARRSKCHRCQNQRNSSCRVNYSSQAMTINNHPKQQSQPNCSLMVRGNVIMQIQEEVLLDLFQAFAPIKDIRMIKNKVTGENKDFAFVEFFSPQQTAFALKSATQPGFRVAGEKVTVMYSRNRQDDDFGKAPPYQSRQYKRQIGGKKQKKQQQVLNYYQIQRQLQIQQQKQRPLITLEQLKEKHQMASKKNSLPQKQLTQEQAKRKQAEILAKQWQRQMKVQNSVMYICPLCRRKFKNQEQMNNHGKYSQLHLYRVKLIQQNSNKSLAI